MAILPVWIPACAGMTEVLSFPENALVAIASNKFSVKQVLLYTRLGRIKHLHYKTYKAFSRISLPSKF